MWRITFTTQRKLDRFFHHESSHQSVKTPSGIYKVVSDSINAGIFYKLISDLSTN